MNRSFRVSDLLLFVALIISSTAYGASTRPAMVGSGADSFAKQLHYPEKAKTQHKQAAIEFYCEVPTDGKPAHINVTEAKGKSEFSTAVDHALRKGYFQPAMVDGKAVPVLLGGTVIFMFAGNQPAIVVSLSTADRDKTAKMGNYIQPQMITSDADFRRRILRARFDPDLNLQPGPHLAAEAMADVDAQGNMGGVKVVTESPSKGGWGALLLKAFKDGKFIAALDNGRPVAGHFNWPWVFGGMGNPDADAFTGTHIK